MAWGVKQSGRAGKSGEMARTRAPSKVLERRVNDPMRDKLVSLLSMLIGQMVTVTLLNGSRYVGILSGALTDAAEMGVLLSAGQALNPAADGIELGEVQGSVLIPGSEIAEVDASGTRMSTAEQLRALQQSITKSKPTGFRTDTEISGTQQSDGRTLQRWDEPEALETGAESLSLSGSTTGWDQFAANEAQFGVKSNYEESIYTTKLDRTRRDFKQREREADKVAREIMSQSAGNTHLAEERNQVEAVEINEEDKYGAVVRDSVKPVQSQDLEKETNPSGRALTADFRQFVSKERDRLVVRKAELAQKEKQNRLSDLKEWAQSFRLKTPVPADMSALRAQPIQKKDHQTASLDAAPKKLSAKTPSFNPQASSFTPGVRTFAPAAPSKPDVPEHPFFGAKQLMNLGSSARVMMDFRPSQSTRQPEPTVVTAWWPYNGAPFRQQIASSSAMRVESFGEGAPMGMPRPPMIPIMGMYHAQNPALAGMQRQAASSPTTRGGKSPRAPPHMIRPLNVPQNGVPAEQQPYTLMYPYAQHPFPAQPSYALDGTVPMSPGGPMMYGAMSPPAVVAQVSFPAPMAQMPPPGAMQGASPGVPFTSGQRRGSPVKAHAVPGTLHSGRRNSAHSGRGGGELEHKSSFPHIEGQKADGGNTSSDT
ncbi:poly(A)-binding protein binding protein [Malassezia vespertilionis]|nr:poly(A)-binding protein binding protein [Malassezia vespertilionis]WFD07578.1 poly(A)-binding protein binding protein [Malassezia vespertilionis]